MDRIRNTSVLLCVAIALSANWMASRQEYPTAVGETIVLDSELEKVK